MTFRKAERRDLPEIVQMLADDPLGAMREDLQHPEKYEQAFDAISMDTNQELMVVESDVGEVVATFQLTFLQYLSHQGSLRVQVESVRVREDQRGKSIGEKMFQWIIARAKDKGAHLVQLTSDKKRPEAIRFYKRLGFVESHEGLKLTMSNE
jgi:GNAT superfamily N-acetyltransferase